MSNYNSALYPVTAKLHVVIQHLIGEIFNCDCGAISGLKVHFLTEMYAFLRRRPSLVDGPVKEPVEQAGVVVVAHREPESPHGEALLVNTPNVVEPSIGSLIIMPQ